MADYESLIDLIPVGKEKAVKNADLQKQTNLTRREISKAVHDFRQKGMIICSDSHGYYIPKNEEELVQGYNVLWGKAIGNLSVLKPMRKEVKKRGLYGLTREAQSRQGKKDEQKAKDNGLSEECNPKDRV